jgi:hypothetical protein
MSKTLTDKLSSTVDAPADREGNKLYQRIEKILGKDFKQSYTAFVTSWNEAKTGLIYSGSEAQREHLKQQMDENWYYLANNTLPSGLESSAVFNACKNGSRLGPMKQGRLKDYFDNSGAMHSQNKFTIAERNILTAAFENWKEYCYLSLPFYRKDDLVGFVHMIYHEADSGVFFEAEKARIERIEGFLEGVSEVLK